MTLFQALVLPVLSGLILFELYNLRTTKFRRIGLIRFALWTAAALTIARPDWTVALATPLGIQRGSDLVFYLFILSSLATTLYFYSRQERLVQRVNALARELAIRDAQLGRSSALDSK